MTDKTKQFLIEKRYSDGSSEKPEIHKIDDIDFSWNTDRRGFLKTTAFGVAALSLFKPVDLHAGDKKNNTVRQKKPGIKKIEVNTFGIKATSEMSYNVAISGNDKLFISSEGSEVKFWEFPSGRYLKKIERGNSTRVALNFDGTLIACNDYDDAKIINTADGSEAADIDGFDPEYGVVACFDGEGKTPIFWHTGENIMYWKDGQFIKQANKVPDGWWPIIFNGDASKMLYVKVIKRESRYALCMRKASEQKDIFSIDYKAKEVLWTGFFAGYSRFGCVVMIRSGVYALDLYDAAEGKLIKRYPIPSSIDIVENWKNFILSPDGRMLLIGSHGELTVYDVETESSVKMFYNPRSYIMNLLFANDSKYVIVSYDHGEIAILNLETDIYHTLFDPAELTEDKKLVTYTIQEKGMTITNTVEANTVLPSGAICTCNSVQGTDRVSSGGGSSCSCNRICTCVPVK